MIATFIIGAISNLFLVAAVFEGPGRADDRFELKVTLGQEHPLAIACFNNARDGGDHYDALTPCHRALAEYRLTDRKRAIVYANRGVIQFNVGDYDAAVSDFSTALDLKIHVQAKIHANRGLSYEALSLDYLAKADYQAALSINPSHRTARERLEELKKPLYDRSRLPRKITAEAPPS